MKIGVLGLQGAITEHVKACNAAINEAGIEGETFWLKGKSQLSEIDGLIIPGGESTTIGRLITKAGMFDRLRDMGKNGFPILGTCAGLILLAKEGEKEIKRTGQPLLKLMDMKVTRNAFGGQRESFEADLDITALGNEPFKGVFIRAPAIKKVWGEANPLARYDDKIVAAEQGNLLAFAFHPELTSDTRVHRYFLKKVKSYYSNKSRTP
ncbi:glutamine amidotransferase [candidate division MSBL1 archaeon SCGC-AAA382M17]|uniref:Pyridoxal 5'-phosphate synthase subunit PdxT n=1 Tax=candidate division MSBL1 archaeon SCGC-AAA382M17 TaxID=1698284 RepID=A0ABR5TK50_9EURY|nr:glutamine amidotransferase [candidate division MSBL1 archaeon SCGC-AAA382M17]